MVPNQFQRKGVGLGELLDIILLKVRERLLLIMMEIAI